jgi:hypothetical protein
MVQNKQGSTVVPSPKTFREEFYASDCYCVCIMCYNFHSLLANCIMAYKTRSKITHFNIQLLGYHSCIVVAFISKILIARLLKHSFTSVAN